MTERIGPTSVTQTWQVGPRKQRRFTTSAEGDADRTQTLRRERVALSIEGPKESTLPNRLELVHGANAFRIDENGLLWYETQKGDNSSFEIEVNEAGSFYFGFSDAKLNGRTVAWSRLRSEDEIALSQWRLTVEGALSDSDKTVVMNRPQGKELLTPRSQQVKRKKGRLFGLTAIGGIALLAAAALVAFRYLSTDEAQVPVPPFTLPAPVATQVSAPLPLPMPESVASSAEQMPEAKAEPAAKHFGKSDFELALQNFRAGKKTRACEMLREAVLASSSNIWTQKAELFLSRRCQR